MAKNRDEYWFEELKKEYPELLSAVHYASIDEGWGKLVSNLCFKIDHYQKFLKDEEKRATVVQIKEKFGGLRFYIYGGDDYIRGLIDFAECMSFSICEACSKPASRSKEGGWIRTLCEDCRDV
jgi:Mor family transcriptional regulator